MTEVRTKCTGVARLSAVAILPLLGAAARHCKPRSYRQCGRGDVPGKMVRADLHGLVFEGRRHGSVAWSLAAHATDPIVPIVGIVSIGASPLYLASGHFDRN